MPGRRKKAGEAPGEPRTALSGVRPSLSLVAVPVTAPRTVYVLEAGDTTVLGTGIFLLYYLVFLVGLELTAPGYIDRVWNLEALSGWRLFGFPIEELLFAAGFGAYWAGVYEHFTWYRSGRHEPPKTQESPR